MTIEASFHINRNNFILDAKVSIPEQGITALFGPSGSGKTTLLRAIAGLDYHRNGSMCVGDKVWQSNKLFVPPHKRSLAYVFQEASLFTHMDVQANLQYGVSRVAETERKISLQDAIELLGIEHLLKRKPHTLSGGERQRVAIARALAVSPRLLLMDEPLASLDLKRKQEVLPYIESLHQTLGIPVIYVSHSIDEVARLADHLVLLGAGKVVASGDSYNMFSQLDLPLAHDNDAAALIDAKVTGYDEKYHLTHLEFAGGKITVVNDKLPTGSTVRLRIAARDVSLTLKPQSGTSILNSFSVIIDEINDEGEAQVMVRLLAKGVPLLARITRKSAVELGLKSKKRVYAQVKSIALLN